MTNKLRLSLDELSEEGYYYTQYDIGGDGHSITIKKEDRDEFLDEFAAEWRKRAARLLQPYEESE